MSSRPSTWIRLTSSFQQHIDSFLLAHQFKQMSSVSADPVSSNIKPTVCGIVSCPPEVLAQITVFLTPYDVGRLWFCGNRALCKAMKFGGVKKLRFSVLPNSQPYFPLLVSEFAQMESFHLYIGSKHSSSSITIDVNTLPRSLKALSLRGFHLPIELAETNVLSYFDELLVLKLPFYVPCDMMMMMSLPSSLTELRIPLADKLLDLVALPTPHLTRLSVWVEKPPLEKLSFDHFESLTSLSVHGRDFQISSFPSQLKSFKRNAYMTPAELRLLPDTLSRLAVPVPRGKDWNELTIPQNVEQLVFRSEFQTSFLNPVVKFSSDHNLRAMFRGLSYLEITSTVFLPDWFISLLPSSLLSLACSLYSTSTRFEIDLPESLTCLSIDFSPKMTFRLPKGLKYLKLPSFIITTPTDLPDQLISFETGSFKCLSLSVREEYKMEPQRCLLPQTLKTLRVRGFRYGNLYQLIPSANLTELSLFYDISLDPTTFPPGWSSALPVTLVSLTLHQIPSQTIDQAWLDALHLPNLTLLDLDGFKIDLAPYSVFKKNALPTSLTHLCINFNQEVPWSSIVLRDLFPEMRTLFVGSLESEVGLDFPKTLPKHLVFLSIPVKLAGDSCGSLEQLKQTFQDAHIDFNPTGKHIRR